MEGQGKNLLLAATLALGVVLAWSYIFPPKQEPKKKPAATETAAGGTAAGVTAEATPPAPEAPRPAEAEIVLEAAEVRAVFSSWGGGLKSWRLRDPKFGDTPGKGEVLERPKDAEAVSFGVHFIDSTVSVPVNAAWEGEKVSETEVRYRYRNDQVEVIKTFTVLPKDLLVKLAIEIKALGTAELKQRLAVATFGYQDPNRHVGGGMGRVERQWKAACQLGDEISSATAPKLIETGGKDRAGNVKWGGFNHPYMLVASAPKNEGGETIACNAHPVKDQPGLMRVDLVWSSATLRAGEPSVQRELLAYLGPKYYEKLEHASVVAGYATHFEDTVDLGWFSFFARPLLWLLQKFYAYVGNWGVAIILLTFLVKLATLYWTNKSMRSMRAMAALQPKIKGLQEKYGEDRQRLQTEMMALYKSHGVNPLAGCLPMILQMPIWIALYRMLSSAGELFHAPFIHGWIEDLTASDPYHILPVVLTAAMFGQSKLSPTTPDQFQQKILMYGLPLMFGVMSFFFPSGLTVYILTNTLLTAAHTLYMNRDRGKELARLEAAKPETIKAEPAAPQDETPAEKSDATRGPVENHARPRRSTRSGRKRRS